MSWRFARCVYRSGLFGALLTVAYLDGQARRLLLGMRPGAAGAVWVHGWCRRLVWALGIECRVLGDVPYGGAVVSNHLSYLDVLVYAAARPFVMVAKTEVREWPLIGWITAQAGTVYVQRADVRGGQTQTHAEVNAAMAAAFATGLPVLFYPEGTTTDGAGVLPFRRGLFHSVLDGKVPLQAAALAYGMEETDGGASVAENICYWGEMEFVPHMFRFLGLRGVRAEVRFESGRVSGADRFELALEAGRRVEALYADAREAVGRDRVEVEGIERIEMPVGLPL